MKERARVCSKCVVRKPIEEFHKDRSAKGGRKPACRVCVNKQRSEWLKRNPENKRAYGRQYRLTHLEQERARNRAYMAKAFLTPRGRARSLVISARRRAKEAGIPFALSTDAVAAIIAKGVCQATGLKFVLTRQDRAHTRSSRAPSLDRKSLKRGYTSSNTQVVCWQFNLAKNEWPYAHLKEMSEAIAARRGVLN